MQLLPLLLFSILCLLVAETAGDDRPASRGHPSRFGKLSPEAKERLAEKIGNLDVRKAHLARLKGPKPLTDEEKAQLEERLAKISPIEEADEDALHDPIAVNLKNGVADDLYEGDIYLTEEQLNQLLASDGSKRQVSNVDHKWANNTVYYYFHPAVDEETKAAVYEAHEFLQSRTCINFIENSTATNRVLVYKGKRGECNSQIGMSGGIQGLSLGDGCGYSFVAAHEFMHALGIWHMQSRSDRDDYVTIDFTYVNESDHFIFRKEVGSINYTPYELGSIMHYRANDFSNTSGKYSIIPHDMDYLPYMGSDEPTFLDILMINIHYGCDAACPAATSADCKNGGVPDIHDCSLCKCPFGYGGTLCDQRPPGCGETLTATANWQFQSASYSDDKNAKSYCTFWINAAEGQDTEIQFVNMTGATCEYACPTNGVEIRKGPDTRITYPKYCCETFTSNITLSWANTIPIIIYNQYFPTNFTFKYRAVKPLPPPRSCYSLDPQSCSKAKESGFCDMSSFSFPEKKRMCGVECDLCGKAADPCVDTHDNCPLWKAEGHCRNTKDPMEMEQACAKTCGYCEYPN